jgi:hypothetical protein
MIWTYELSHIIKWLIVAVAVAGAAANVRGRWWGFLFWLVSNGYWAVYYARAGQWAEAAAFAIFWWLSVYGVFRWRSRQSPDVTILRRRLRAAEITIGFLRADMEFYKKKASEQGRKP